MYTFVLNFPQKIFPFLLKCNLSAPSSMYALYQPLIQGTLLNLLNAIQTTTSNKHIYMNTLEIPKSDFNQTRPACHVLLSLQFEGNHCQNLLHSKWINLFPSFWVKYWSSIKALNPLVLLNGGKFFSPWPLTSLNNTFHLVQQIRPLVMTLSPLHLNTQDLMKNVPPLHIWKNIWN